LLLDYEGYEERREEKRGDLRRKLWATPRSEFFSSFSVSVFLILSSLLIQFSTPRPLCDNFIVRRLFLRLNRQILPFRYIQKRKRETKEWRIGALIIVTPAIRQLFPSLLDKIYKI